MKEYLTVRNIVTGALVAAIYFAITVLFAPFSYSLVQVRVSEALTVLPMFTGAAVPGLFIGCVFANWFGGLGIFDIVVGSLATLLAAMLTRLLRKSAVLALLPPVLVNAVAVGYVLAYIVQVGAPFYVCALSVAAGQAIACYGIGLPLSFLLGKYKGQLFK